MRCVSNRDPRPLPEQLRRRYEERIDIAYRARAGT